MGFDSASQIAEPLPATTLGTSGLGSGLGFGGILGVISPFMSLIMFLVALIFIALVLYYFTGNNKKAEGFMPNLMSQSFRIFYYVWMYIVSLAAFGAVASMLTEILEEILPEAARARASEFEGETFFTSLVVFLFTLIFAAVLFYLNRAVVTTSGVGGTVSTKTFLTFGIVTYSIVYFVSTLLVVSEFMAYLYDTDMGLSANTWSWMFAGLAFLGVFVARGMMVLRNEK